MIHQYKLNGYNIVLDVCSGSVHAVDEVAYDIIGMFESNTEDPKKYTDAIKCGFEMKHNVKYDIYEVLNNV